MQDVIRGPLYIYFHSIDIGYLLLITKGAESDAFVFMRHGPILIAAIIDAVDTAFQASFLMIYDLTIIRSDADIVGAYAMIILKILQIFIVIILQTLDTMTDTVRIPFLDC
jgi:hypothetical protein